MAEADDAEDDDGATAAEDRYLQKLLDDEFKEKKAKKDKKKKDTAKASEEAVPDLAEKISTYNAEIAAADKEVDSEVISGDCEDEESDEIDEVKLFNATDNPLHESLIGENEQLEKAKRTIFVGNLNNSVISSKVSHFLLSIYEFSHS